MFGFVGCFFVGYCGFGASWLLLALCCVVWAIGFGGGLRVLWVLG